MIHSLTMTEHDAAVLFDIIFSQPDREGAAYLLCGRSITDDETRLLVRDVVPVRDEDYLVREWDRMSIRSESYVPVAKRAMSRDDSVIFVHSHPTGVDDFSPQDNREEPKLMEFFDTRVPTAHHGSLVVVSPSVMKARLWTAGGWTTIDRIRQVGTRFRFLDRSDGEAPLPLFFDRQVRAFGPDTQRLLMRLHIGIVGAGGTGSAVIEQLIRLGVGTISVFDGERLERSNVNRVYGSGAANEGHAKVAIAQAHAARIGLKTRLFTFDRPISEAAVAQHLRSCDLVFGCTDRQAPRGTLVRLSAWYLIPVIDLGVKITAPQQIIRDVVGRVTVVTPGEACLFCRGRISAEHIRLETLSTEERQRLADEEYAPELEDPAPAVIPFTTAVAAQGISELLHRLTGYMGETRVSSETLLFFHEPSIKTNRTPPRPDCLCADRKHQGKGDRRSFLDMMWPATTTT